MQERGAMVDIFTTDLIKKLEGFSEKSYVDASGRSIGYGHFIKAGEEHLKGKTLSKQEAEQLLSKDIYEHQKGWIDQAKAAGMSQTQIAGLTSFAYNTGGKAVPEIIRRWKSGDKTAAAELMLSYNKAFNPKTGVKEFNKHLYDRRLKEILLSLQSDPQKGMDDKIMSLAKDTGNDIKNFLASAGDKLKKGLDSFSSSLGDMFKSTDAAQNRSMAAADILLGENQQILADLGAISASMGNVFDDSNWLQQLRQEGANLRG